MAAKKQKNDKAPVRPDSKSVTYVKAAGMWCTTQFAKGVQKQSWSAEKPA